MYKQIVIAGIILVLPLTACKKSNSPPQARGMAQDARGVSQDVSSGSQDEIATLRKVLAEAQAEAVMWKAQAEALSSAASKSGATARGSATSTKSKNPDPVPNAERPVGDRVIRGWDINANLWRDVRIKDFKWSLVDNALVAFGQSKTNELQVVERLDQEGEAWVIEFVTGKKVEIPRR
jgi:hypothetical protein